LFKPSIVNRLDRNTNGLIIFAKTYIAAREITDMIKENRIKKYYRAVVNGKLCGKAHLINLYRKDEKNNKAEIYDFDEKKLDSYDKVELYYSVISSSDKSSIVDVDLITGKSHQIRAQFSYIGHPLVSDKKYMDIGLYKKNVEEFGIKSQKLLCYKIKFGNFESESLKNLSKKSFSI
jgi:23S rRNA pseudouridine955/2504/2580 synthase